MRKVLTLSIKQKYFNQIISGNQKVETREIKPNNVKRYLKVDEDGYAVEDSNIGFLPREYDVIKLFTGAYTGKRPFLIVEVEKAEVFLLTDEYDEWIILLVENQNEYNAAIIKYTLGKVIDKFIH